MSSPFVAMNHISRVTVRDLEAFSNKKPSQGPNPINYLAKIQEIPSPSIRNLSDPAYLKDAGLVLRVAEGASAIGDPALSETLARALSFFTDTKDYVILLTGDLASCDEMIQSL
ncbi:hypothetical protein NE237_024933 [Protea cynaroides]|uniref:Uncharacterized protein n=1 Tax=Protea cynaroides TaxID=273540 RepID=A0A9Q0H565_9MAGN|nr:hypothetical protein NE237_024933 [Protea cynaroides]